MEDGGAASEEDGWLPILEPKNENEKGEKWYKQCGVLVVNVLDCKIDGGMVLAAADFDVFLDHS